MSIETKLTPTSATKSTVESLHRAAVVGALEVKLRVARLRARVLSTDRAELLTGILSRVQGVIEQLAAMPRQVDGGWVDEDLEHIGPIAQREMRRWAAGQLAGDAL
jgi:hypothetical protein